MNNKSKSSIILTSLGAIALAGSVIAGATYALFTSESKTNIAVSSGKVDVTATVDSLTLSHKEANAEGVYETIEGSLWSGTATLDDKAQTLTLEKLVPMDKITFNIVLTNNSNVAAKYRTVVEATEKNGLFSGLDITVNNESFEGSKVRTDYADLAVGSEPITIPVSIELPEEVGNEYQDTSCTLSYKVEAVQGNAFSGVYEVTPTNAQEVLDSVKDNATVILTEGDYDKLYLRQDLDVSTRRSDLDVDKYSYPAFYRAFKGLTIKAKEGATVNCKGITLEGGLFWHDSAPASNQEAMGRGNSGFISYLEVTDLTIEGINFNDNTSNAVYLRSNHSNAIGSPFLVDNLLIKNCTGTGDTTNEDVHFLLVSQGIIDETFLSTGKKAVNNIFVVNNTISSYYQPICSNNASAVINGLTLKNNTFESCLSNIVQLSQKEITGELVFANNTLVSMKGRFARIANASSDAVIRLRNNKVFTPIQYDEPTNPQIFKVTSEVAGFKVFDTNNEWEEGSFDEAKTTWIALGSTTLIA